MDSSIKAYIAGFLDGDGSIMLQIKPRVDVRYGYRLYTTICLYQHSTHEDGLHWIREQLQVGYVSKRNDGMSELRIDGYSQVEAVLLELKEHIRFKKRQTELMLQALALLKHQPTAQEFLIACKIADEISKANYTSTRKHSAEKVEEFLSQKGLLSP